MSQCKKPRINQEKCEIELCFGMCADECPFGAIIEAYEDENGYMRYQVDEEACEYCENCGGVCMDICPAEAIEIPK